MSTYGGGPNPNYWRDRQVENLRIGQEDATEHNERLAELGIDPRLPVSRRIAQRLRRMMSGDGPSPPSAPDAAEDVSAHRPEDGQQ